MTGYNHQLGMSNNAVVAYSCGIMPLSKFTASDLKACGWQGTLALAKYLAKKELWTTTEYHHTGGTWYNETHFYDVSHLNEAWNELNIDEQSKLITAAKPTTKRARGVKVEGHYAEFGGSSRRPKYLGEISFTGVKLGNWIFIDGSKHKKLANGNHIFWHQI